MTIDNQMIRIIAATQFISFQNYWSFWRLAKGILEYNLMVQSSAVFDHFRPHVKHVKMSAIDEKLGNSGLGSKSVASSELIM